MSKYDVASTDDVPADIGDDDLRVLEITREYHALLESGKQPAKQDFIQRYPQLRELVKECLEGIDLAHSLKASKPPLGSELAAEPLGDFKIVREIGRGGMATVYEAVQLSLGRHVALKVLPFTSALDERQRQRFQIESHAAASLHHSNIVPVYAVGCERGVHYYAMQLIDGEPLSAWITRMRQDRGTGDVNGRSLTAFDSASSTGRVARADTIVSSTSRTDGRKLGTRFQTIADLISQIADALEYAHKSGVIHRDIKPANLLVDSKGTGWITDFGLAQISSTSNLTQTGDIVGTLRYMSPEQASGKRVLVSHLTDIYSLGATLYELLCLQPIFAGSDRQQLFHNILSNEPRPLREIDRSIPIELETIVMKTLSKSPMDRYATAADLSSDLRRFLSERPILAKRPTLVDHSRKWIRRHPLIVVSSFVVLVVGVIGLSVAMAAISHEQRKTRQALYREQLRSTEAEHRLALAQQAADDMIALAEYELSSNPFDEGLRKKLLESALAHYQSVIAEQKANPTAQVQLKKTRDRVEQILADLAVVQADRESHILQQPDVLSDLDASADQIAELDDWFRWRIDQMHKSIEHIRNTPPVDEIGREATIRIQILRDAQNSASVIRKILSERQLMRLKQLSFQFQGSRAFHESEVINALQLTNEQRATMRAIESEHRFSGGPSHGRGGRPGVFGRPPLKGRPDDPPPRRVEPTSPQDQDQRHFDSLPPLFAPRNNADQLRQIVDVLTQDQLKIWNQLIGTRFDGDIDSGQMRPF